MQGADQPTLQRASASPYSTGGGGVRLEHRVAALFLARLLTDGAVSELGERAPTRVAFQQSPGSSVDDLVLTGEAKPGVATVRLAIAVRRAPKFIKSDEKTNALVLALVRADLAAERAGGPQLDDRLAIAVSGYQQHARDVAELATVARNHTDAHEFFSVINKPGKFATSDRLGHLRDMVKGALAEIADENAGSAEHRCWSLLTRLHVIDKDLEPGRDADWTALLDSLRPVTVDHSPTSAVALRDRLEQLAGEFAQSAATVDRGVLRRRLRGVIDPTAHVPVAGWSRLLRLDKEARSAVPRTLVGSGTRPEFKLARAELRIALDAALQEAGDLIVKGESGVGKSVLILDATEPSSLGEDREALALNLRHLPSTQLDLLTQLESPLDELFGEMTARDRLLVIDGAEAAAEDRSQVFGHILRCARASGVKVIVTASTEREGIVLDLMKPGATALRDFVVPPLSDDEVALAAQNFPELQRLAGDSKGRELLRRPIVVDLLARAGDPGVPLSEAEALDHIWRQLVQNAGRRDAGAPDVREQVMLRLAAHALSKGDVDDLLTRLDNAAVEGLRQSGLLRSAGGLPWERVPEFKHDLLRAYSVARQLLVERNPSAALTSAGAPRWALPAARLACEILLSTPDGATHPMAGRFAELQASFDELVAAGQGERWADMPTEALLVVADPRPPLQDAWQTLLANNSHGVARLIRVLHGRHQPNGFLDPIVAEPVIIRLLEGETPHGLTKEVADLIRDWLMSYILRGTPKGQPTRLALAQSIVTRCAENERTLDEQEAATKAAEAARTPEEVAADEEQRKRLMALGSISPPRRRRRPEPRRRRPYLWIQEAQIAHLALLGPDLGADGEAILRRIAEDEPHSLAHAVDALFGGHGLAAFDSTLLIDLVAAYYVEGDDDDDDDEIGFGQGIRNHQFGGLETPLAAYYRGPFLAMFRADYRGGVACLNRMLNHAARRRVQTISSRGFGYLIHEEVEEYRHMLSITGEPRAYVGDKHVWLWYRGTGVGPYPCMSALQALELVSEEIIRVGVPVTNLIPILLDGAESLAMPALALSLLVRHLESVGEALDPYIIEPTVWDLEFSRMVSESSGLAAQVPGIDNLDRRSWTLREVCMMLALRAGGERIERLRQLGEQLQSNAKDQVGEDSLRRTQERLAAVKNWAASLDRSAYDMREQNGQLVIQQAVNPEVEAVLGPTNTDLRRGNEAAGLLVRHAHVRNNGGRAPDMADDALAADLAIAKDLLENPPESGLGTSPKGPVAVAATAVELHFSGRTKVASEDLEWSATTLLRVAAGIAENPSHAFDDSLFNQGADRSAARGLPCLLLPGAAYLRTALGLDSSEGVQELVVLSRAVASYSSNEARIAYARGLDSVWAAPCYGAHLHGQCHHRVALALVEESFSDSVLGPWDNEAHRRTIAHLDPPAVMSLEQVDGKEIIPRRLTAALRATGSAGISESCCRDEARRMVDVLLAAHQRGMLAHKHGYHHSDSDSLVAARAALWQAIDGRDHALLAYVDSYLGNSRLLAEALKAISVAGDERAEAAKQARRLWPVIMDRVLDSVANNPRLFTDHHWGDYAESALIPNPSPSWGYLTIELAGEPHPWRDPLAWSPQIERWLGTIEGHRMSIDSLVIAISELGVADQVKTGLKWIEAIVQRSGTACANTFTLPEWLHNRRADLTTGEQTARWQRVVDLLVVAGDTRVADLAD